MRKKQKNRLNPKVKTAIKKYGSIVLLSHKASPAVPSPMKGLTSVFGMGTGISLSLWTLPNRYFAVRPLKEWRFALIIISDVQKKTIWQE